MEAKLAEDFVEFANEDEGEYEPGPHDENSGEKGTESKEGKDFVHGF